MMAHARTMNTDHPEFKVVVDGCRDCGEAIVRFPHVSQQHIHYGRCARCASVQHAAQLRPGRTR